MMHTPAHKNVQHPPGQFDGGPIGGDLRLGRLNPNPFVAPEDQFIHDPFEARKGPDGQYIDRSVTEAAVESPAFYMAKIADTLDKMEALMGSMLEQMKPKRQYGGPR